MFVCCVRTTHACTHTGLPGRAVVELVQQSVGQDGSVLVDKDVFAAVDADQQADDV